jgi:hypothetical protein
MGANNWLRFACSWGKLCLTRQKRKYVEIKEYSKIKRHTNLDRHGPRPIATVCHLPGPPSFSLQTTFEL